MVLYYKSPEIKRALGHVVVSTTPNGISFRLFVNIQDVLEDASDDEDGAINNVEDCFWHLTPGNFLQT